MISFAFDDLYRAQLPLSVQTILLAAFALSFAIKVPIVPLHTWLPDAHVEAPTAGSVILAGVLLKMGTYGFMKLGFPLFPDAARDAAPLIVAFAVVSIIYGACLALVQTDIKKIIAYSSISHLGYVMLGLVSLDLIGIQGAIVQMVSHGLTAAGLFLMVGMIYERCHSARARGVRRPRQDPARVRGVLHDPDAGVDRTARDERIHRRVPGAARRLRRVVEVYPPGRPASSCSRSARSSAWCWARSTCSGSRSASCSARSRRRTARRATWTCARHDPRAARCRDLRPGSFPGGAAGQDRARRARYQALVMTARLPRRRTTWRTETAR